MKHTPTMHKLKHWHWRPQIKKQKWKFYLGKKKILKNNLKSQRNTKCAWNHYIFYTLTCTFHIHQTRSSRQKSPKGCCFRIQVTTLSVLLNSVKVGLEVCQDSPPYHSPCSLFNHWLKYQHPPKSVQLQDEQLAPITRLYKLFFPFDHQNCHSTNHLWHTV